MVAGPATAQTSRVPLRTFGPPSTYLDPCEHTPEGLTGAAVDLRELVVDDPFEFDRQTTNDTQPVSLRFRLCRPVDQAEAPPLRIDLHARIDGIGGPDTDYSEDPSRWVLFLPPDGGSWTWELHAAGADPSLLDSGVVDVVGPSDAITELVAKVPTAELRAAGDPDTASATGLPPLAVRACTQAEDCGPGYAQGPGGATRITAEEADPDVDYVPEPRHLALTYPSICQTGPVASSRGATRSTVAASTGSPGGASQAPARITVDATTADRLDDLGWSRLATLPDARAVFRGSVDAVRAAVPGAVTSPVALRRASIEPSDPYFPASGPGAPTGQWSLRRVGASTAWDSTTGSPDVLVAVVDSGFDGLHPDLAGRAAAGRDYVETRLTTPRPLDLSTDTDFGGHGSFVASIVGALTDDGNGMAGLGWQTRLLVARVFDAESCASDASLIDALDWAATQGAAAVNLSLGGPDPSDELRDAGAAAAAAGTIPVAAAGNSGGDDKDYPAFYDAYLSVAATGYAQPGANTEDPIAPYSTRNTGVDIAAPGGAGADQHKVLGACWQDPFAMRGYCRLAGTSFAAPIVSATIGLARSLDPGRTVEGIRQLLDDTARDLTGCAHCEPGWDVATGSGRIDTGKAVSWLGGRLETLTRVGDGTDAVSGSVAASQATFARGEATSAVLTRDDVFADALAGAPLAGSTAPILLTPTARLDDRTAAELTRVLPLGSTVTLLGGPQALAPQVETDVRNLGYATRRLEGATRIQTAIAIANQVVRGPGGQVLIGSAANWPDAVAAGAYAAAARVPLLLTWPDSAEESRSPGLLSTLASYQPSDVVVLGGAAAVSSAAANQIAERVGEPRRVAGDTRNETAAQITTELWGRRTGAAGDRFTVIDGWGANGWAFGLSASPFAAKNLAPLLLVRPGLTYTDPTILLHDVLTYRLPKPAFGTFFGPVGGTADVNAYTLDRLGELLGG